MANRAKQAVKKATSLPARSPAGNAPIDVPAPRPSVPSGGDRKRPAAGSPSPDKTHDKAATALERERDELKAALDTAVARIRTLEDAQALVANRIGWMIEALQTLRDEGR